MVAAAARLGQEETEAPGPTEAESYRVVVAAVRQQHLLPVVQVLLELPKQAETAGHLVRLREEQAVSALLATQDRLDQGVQEVGPQVSRAVQAERGPLFGLRPRTTQLRGRGEVAVEETALQHRPQGDCMVVLRGRHRPQGPPRLGGPASSSSPTQPPAQRQTPPTSS